MFINPDRTIEKAIKGYDKNLSVLWNNQDKCWEIWYKRPTGKKLVTPIVEAIYVDGGRSDKFCPLDYRILSWLYSADTVKHPKCWRWLGRKRYDERHRSIKQKNRNLMEYVARENYAIANKELMNPHLLIGAGTDRPNITGKSRGRVGYSTKYHGGSR
jgi:hypothetical protein